MKQIVITRENEKLTGIGIVSVVDEKTFLELQEELKNNIEEKIREINKLEKHIQDLEKRLEKAERELAYNRGDIDTL